jgi:CheY-like chemotaxis protein
VRTILIVDDEPDVSRLFQLTLEPAGYEVACAADGAQAVRMLAARRFDLVITDLLMPERDGLQLIADLRRTYPNLPILAMSGGGRMSAELYLKMARGFRVEGLLRKPFDTQEILSAVRDVEMRAGLPAAPCAA